MYEEFDGRIRTKIVRDADGVARMLSHTDGHVAVKAATPQAAANDYLNRYGHLFGLKQQHLKNLTRGVVQDPTGAPVDYRFLREKSQFDVTTVAFDQTRFGLAVWEAGISVTMKHNPLRVIGARSTLHAKLDVKRPSATHVAKAKAIDVETLAKCLGLAGVVRRGVPLTINAQKFMIFRYHETTRRRAITPAKRHGRPSSGHPTLPLPPVHASIRDGKDYVVRAVYFSFDFPPVRPLHWVAIIEVETESVLLAYPFIANVMGWVFKADPTTLGGPTADAGNAALNRWRSPVRLEGLAAPVDGTQALSGARVTVADVSTPKVAPPTKPAGKDFKYHARSNDFAAVNAYYNVDRIFRLVEDLGFPITDYFPGTTFPSRVDHRGHFDKDRPRGNEINAHCAGNTAGTGIDYTIFALANMDDQKNPIGIAGDWRIALHELLGHGVLYNHIGNARFKFAHSAGDSFAAILNDPGSKAKDRYDTFPWLVGVEKRRHDRTAGGGWGWSGKIGINPFDDALDSLGYNNEQILSSTMFRFYRAIGGDASALADKRFAARMTCHLLLAAIGSLTVATSPRDAAHFAAALSKADAADWPARRFSGGAYHKVIRWAFEKQGLYQDAKEPKPNNKEGLPPPVDVYIEDGRHGEYRYQSNYWNCRAIWNRRRDDRGTAHETPQSGVTNYAYVKIKNRGSQKATKVAVRAFHAPASAKLTFPGDWQPMQTARRASADVPPHSSAEVLVGPFAWVRGARQEAMLMIVAAAGDSSNIDNFTAADSIPNWRLIPNDNNIAQRNTSVAAKSKARR
jgi:zinc metalloprotease ZmpB